MRCSAVYSLIQPLRGIVSNDSRHRSKRQTLNFLFHLFDIELDSHLNLPLVEPRLEASDATLRASSTPWKIEPKRKSETRYTHGIFKRYRACGAGAYHVRTATKRVMTPSTMNNHFQPSSPPTPCSCSRPEAMSPLTALAIF